MKNLILAAKRLHLRLQMRSATAEIEAAKQRIENDKLLMDRLFQIKHDLHGELLWLEKKSFSVKGLNA